jgi:hypothetical protein
MRLTTKELRKIISEEVSNVLAEADLKPSNPVNPPAQEPEKPGDLEKLTNAFKQFLDKFSGAFNPIANKIDTKDELIKILIIMIDFLSDKTKGGLNQQEVINALNVLRTYVTKNPSS